MRRTSRARMRSLIRCCSRCGGAAMAVHPCAMADLLLLFGCSTREPAEQTWVWTQQCRWPRTHHRGRGGGFPRFSRDDPVRVTDVADESTRGDEHESRLAEAQAAIDEARRRLHAGADGARV